MHRIFIVIFMILFLPCIGLADERGENIVFYEEQFNDNTGFWELFDTTGAMARIDGGKYYIYNKRKTRELFILHHTDFPLDREFIIAISIKAIMTSDDHSYGFAFGARNASYSFLFQIIGDDSYSIKKYQKGVAEELSGGKIDNMVLNEASFNTLKMERQEDTILFYINNKYIDEVSGLSFFGRRIGFFAGGKSKIAVDYTRSQVWLD